MATTTLTRAGSIRGTPLGAIMRQIALNNKKLRGISRRVRASETWALSFKGYVRARFDETELHFNWKIPVHSVLVQGSQGRLDT